jgi:peptidoglycan/LPS O-acetylase OafA/YrhL
MVVAEHPKRRRNHMPTRPLPVIIAAILLALFSLLNLLAPLLLVGGPPAFVIYLSVVLGVLGLVAVAGLWMLKRWSMWLAIVLSVLGILSAAPGLTAAPTPLLRLLATVGVVGSALIILLVVLPNSRRAYT